MEKNNGKIVAVVALAIAVVALSVGFAAFAATLTIDSNATITASNAFTDKVNYVTDTPKCYYTGGSTTAEGSVAGSASAKSWTGVKVALSDEHKSVTCEADVLNASEYVAYLRQISIGGALTCASTGTGDAAATNADTICGTVSAKVDVSTDSHSFTTTAATAKTDTGSSITAGGTEHVKLTIAYTSTAKPDGDISITVPTISLLYKTNAS